MHIPLCMCVCVCVCVCVKASVCVKVKVCVNEYCTNVNMIMVEVISEYYCVHNQKLCECRKVHSCLHRDHRHPHKHAITPSFAWKQTQTSVSAVISSVCVCVGGISNILYYSPIFARVSEWVSGWEKVGVGVQLIVWMVSEYSPSLMVSDKCYRTTACFTDNNSSNWPHLQESQPTCLCPIIGTHLRTIWLCYCYDHPGGLLHLLDHPWITTCDVEEEISLTVPAWRNVVYVRVWVHGQPSAGAHARNSVGVSTTVRVSV